MSTYIFIGPTIREAEARQHLTATYLPPVSQGDIVSLLLQSPKVIGIIDGYFERIPAVWHKEILLALSKGVHVFGAASMGALRAAELAVFGMVGVGQIFEWYQKGVIEADDEVAVRHAPASHGYRVTGEALVNIRRTLAQAVNDSVITPTTHDQLLVLAQQIPYLERDYPTLLARAKSLSLPPASLAALQAYPKINQKKLDAVALLDYIATLPADLKPFQPDFKLHYTTKLVSLIEKDFCLGTFEGIRVTADMLVNHARLACPDFVALRERAAQHQKAALLAEEMLNNKMVNLNNHAIIEQLKSEGLYGQLLEETVAKEGLYGDMSPPFLSEGVLYQTYFTGKALSEIETERLRLGFNHKQTFLIELNKYYFYQQYPSKKA